MSNNTRRKGFSFLSFFLGILFGIILLLGAIVGGVACVLIMDADSVLGFFGLDNSADEDGKNQYINTDVENGGVSNMWELVSGVISLAGDFDNKSIGDFEKLMPVAGSLTDTVHEMLSEYVKLDKEELKAVKFSEFGGYIQDVVLDLEPAALMEKFGGSLGDNELISVILCGAEADYVEVDGVKYPVRVQNDGAEGSADLYFYTGSDGVNYELTEADGVYTATGNAFAAYDADKAKLSGNFYYADGDKNGEKIIENPVTLRTFAEGGDAVDALNKLKVVDFVEGADDTVTKVLGDITVGQLVSGEADFKGMIDGLALSDFMDISPDSAIMAYLGYGIIDLKFNGENGAYTGTYKRLATADEPAADIPCFAVEEAGKITRAYYAGESGEEIEINGTTISEISKRIDGVTNDIKIGQLMTIDDGNKFLNAVKNSTVNSLSDDISKLTINELYADEIYQSADLYEIAQADFDAAFVYYDVTGDGVYALSGGSGKVFEWREGLYTYGAPKPLWKLMLYTYTKNGDTVDDNSGTESTYTVNNITQMIDNVTTNIDNATLDELCEANILSLTEEQRNKTIGGSRVGRMKLSTVLATILNGMPNT